VSEGARAIEAVVFDMDGVLLDSEPYWREAEIEAFAPLGIDLTDAMLDETFGMRVADVVEHYHARSPWLEPELPVVANRILDGVIERVRSRGVPAPGALEAVERFEGLGLRLALASSSPHRLIDATLEVLGLAGRFDVVHSAQDLALGKPDPAVYLEAATALETPPERCLAIEDSPAGVRAARAAGMACIAVPPTSALDAVRAAGADLVLGSLLEADERALAAGGLVVAPPG